MAVGTLFYLPFSMKDIFKLRFTELSFQSWGALFYSGLFALVISYVIWYSSVKKVGNSKTAIYGNITPVITVFLAYIFLSETITLFQAGGALVIFVGVYLTRSGYQIFEKKPQFFFSPNPTGNGA